MSLTRTTRLFKTVLAATLAFVLVALAPGLAPYEALAQFQNGAVGAVRGPSGPAVVIPVTSIGGVTAIPGAGTFAPSLNASLPAGLIQSAPTAAAASAFAMPGAPAASAFLGAPTASFSRSGAVLPSLPSSALAAAPVAAVPTAAVARSLEAAALKIAPAAADGREAAPVTARGQLTQTVSALEGARGQAKTGLLDSFYTGMRRYFGLDESAPVSASAAPAARAASFERAAAPSASFAALTPAPAVLSRAAAATPDQAKPVSGESRATPPSPVSLEGPGLQKGDKFLAGPAAPSAAPAAPEAPKGDDWIDKKGVTGMFIQRSISISAFILTSLAYPLVAIHAVGGATFGVLMALGPLAAIATGPLNGFIADKMSPRNGLILLAVIRGLLAFALPAFSYFGILSFGTLLLASIANGWQLSLLMTSESAYFRRLAGKNQIETINSLGAVNFMSLQVFLTLIVGIGSFIDKWNPMMPFVLSTILHLTVVPAIIWFMIPNVAPNAKAKIAAAAHSFSETVSARVAGAKAFFKKYWKEIGLLGLSVGAYLLWHSPLPMSASLFWWVSRTDGFKTVWSQKSLRATMLLSALAFGLIYPFQYMALPLMAGIIGGTAGKGLILGQLLGALFFGQLVSNASQAKLPSLRIPFTQKSIPAQALIKGVVLAMGAAWSFLRLFPGNWLAVAASVAMGSALMYGASKFTSRGWVKFLGIGLAAASLLPLMFWGSMPAIFAGMLALGLFTGPTSVALNSYFSRNAKEASIGNAFGVNSSLMNASTSFGYGLMTLLISFFHPAFPAALGPIALAFLAVGAIFFFAPKFLPGLPDKSFGSPAKPADKK